MTTFTVALPAGPVEVSAALSVPADSVAAVAIAHGAGAGMDHAFLRGFSDALNAERFATMRFNFPYVEAGRRMPGPPGHAIATWRAAAATLVDAVPGVAWIAAGKSYGGRMASMAAAAGDIAPAALVYLGYPLHAPGKPESPRGDHLAGIDVPQLFVEGSIDPFIQPLDQFAQIVATCSDAEVRWIEGGGHSFEVKGRRREPDVIAAELAASVAAWWRTRS